MFSGTRDIKLSFPLGQGQPLTLEGFSDSDHAGCPDSRQSTSGYVFKLVSTTIKQRSVATSTLEAEYMALALATKQYLWLLRGLEELGYSTDDLRYSLSTDNTGVDDLVHNPRIRANISKSPITSHVN